MNKNQIGFVINGKTREVYSGSQKVGVVIKITPTWWLIQGEEKRYRRLLDAARVLVRKDKEKKAAS